MKIYEKVFNKRIIMARIIKFFSSNNRSNIDATFQVYLDLSLFRGWDNVKITFNESIQLYTIQGSNPRKQINVIELFIPLNPDIKIDIIFFKRLLLHLVCGNVGKKLPLMNIAFVDQDSTVSYYYLTVDIHKTIGPCV